MDDEITSRKRSNPAQKKNPLKNKGVQIGLVLVVVVLVAIAVYALYPKNQTNTPTINRFAVIDTTKGTITVELYEDKMPITTANFIKLANDGFYNGLVFHRVIDNFMIQGGGFYPNGTQKQDSYGAIKLETSPDVLHVDGAISMARLSSPVDSATSQFFICDGAQTSLNGQYAAFGKVVDNASMDVVHAISSVQTTTKYTYMENWPVTDVFINSITIENQ